MPQAAQPLNLVKEKNMQITDILVQAGGIQSIAQELGVSESQAASGAEALLPAIRGFKQQAQSQPAGLTGLGGLLGGLLGGQSARGAAQGGGIASTLDLNGDGNPLDDILQMAGKVLH